MFGLEKNVGDPTRNFFCAIPVPQSRRSPAKNLKILPLNMDFVNLLHLCPPLLLNWSAVHFYLLKYFLQNPYFSRVSYAILLAFYRSKTILGWSNKISTETKSFWAWVKKQNLVVKIDF